MSHRVDNFCSGPAALPTAVLEKAQAELLDWQGMGVSVMELSHRSQEFQAVCDTAEKNLRDLLGIPVNYRVLFLQGGATLQFSAIPLNLASAGQVADYIDTGIWSRKALAEGKRYCAARVAASADASGYTSVPPESQWQLSDKAAYVHITPNETIGGVEFDWIPETGDVPLVADLSSTILSRPLDVSRFGLIYAGAQKNIGPSGLTVVIVREDLLDRAQGVTPTLLSYRTQADNGSMYNTPPTLAIYLAGLVFEWLREQGGLSAMAEINRRKAARLYAYIDESDFYNNPIEVSSRSWMNIPFTLADDQLNGRFLNEAEESGLLNLQGHRSVGGMRASIYNAISEDAVGRLIGFMDEFARQVR